MNPFGKNNFSRTIEVLLLLVIEIKLQKLQFLALSVVLVHAKNRSTKSDTKTLFGRRDVYDNGSISV